MDTFPRYVQPLFTSLDYDPPSHITDDVWKQHMVQLQHNNEPTTTKKRSSNRATTRGVIKKRKRSLDTDDPASKGAVNDSDGGGCGGGGSVDDHLVWNFEDLVQKRHNHQQQQHHADVAIAAAEDQGSRVISNGEDDACVLEYMHQRHRRNLNAAKMNLLVDLSAGRGKILLLFDSFDFFEFRTMSGSWRLKPFFCYPHNTYSCTFCEPIGVLL